MADTITTSSNADLLTRAERVMSGGVPAGHRLPAGTDFVVARGRGSRVWDVDGREYVDFVLGSGPMILGHAHPAVVEAVSRQVALGTQFYMTTPPAIELAETIVEAAGGEGLVKFASGGGEANAHAVRLARAHTGRSKVLKFEGGYHGGQDVLLMSVAPAQPTDGGRAQPDSAGITEGVRQDVLVAPYNDLESTGRLLAAHAADTACVLIEPQQRTIDPKPGFLSGLRELTRQHQTLLIFDEVVTGFRLAYGGAREYYGVQPDLATYAKIVGGGLPLAAIWGRTELLAPTDPGHKGAAQVLVRGTLNGNPLSATAGLTTIRELTKPGVYERLHQLGARLRSGLAAAAARQRTPLQIVGEGPLAAIYFSSEPVADYQAVVRSDRARINQVGVEMLRRGILVNLNAKFYLSLAHSDADVDAAVEAFEAGLIATAA